MSRTTPSFKQVAAKICRFLEEIYGDLPDATRVEIDCEGLSGGAYGTPHLEVVGVRVYAEASQLLPSFEIPYWKAILQADPDWFKGCTTHQDRLDAVEEHFDEERLYLDYGLDWPDENEKILSPLRLSIQELHALAGEGSDDVVVSGTIADFETIMACALVRVAELLHEAGGYDEGDEIDLAECMAFAVAGEIIRRYEVGPQTFNYVMGTAEVRVVVEGTLQLDEDGLPASYKALHLRKGAHFRNLAGLEPAQFMGVLAHAVLVLVRYLQEVYDFESPFHIVSFTPALKSLAEVIERQHLDASYQEELLFEN